MKVVTLAADFKYGLRGTFLRTVTKALVLSFFFFFLHLENKEQKQENPIPQRLYYFRFRVLLRVPRGAEKTLGEIASFLEGFTRVPAKRLAGTPKL